MRFIFTDYGGAISPASYWAGGSGFAWALQIEN